MRKTFNQTLLLISLESANVRVVIRAATFDDVLKHRNDTSSQSNDALKQLKDASLHLKESLKQTKHAPLHLKDVLKQAKAASLGLKDKPFKRWTTKSG